ncbi:MAG TPA: hypothetical protein VMZ92_13965 [Planctomycetota bacterium]|nr:hypothetical protein [Planctomycetota bacterium]
MSVWRRLTVILLVTGLCAVLWAAESREELTRRLWPREHVMKVLKDVEKQKTDGLITEKMYQRKKQMLTQRLAGTFRPTTLSATNPPLNLVQNASFEDYNPNTRRNMSRWDWWGGWAWPENAQYENTWEDRAEYVKAGKYSARFKCTGAPARTGINQGIPTIEGATGYELTIWARGEGENMLHIAFESGARGQFMEKIGPEWRQITVTGNPDAGAKKFTLYIYARGGGTIWVDDARLLPLGVQIED